ncbi:MAG: beta-N-acetylhexosaminidase [Rhodanobacteraceae bacterium]|jgi:beta-N-acetylhexosaminidase|nr:beta-N-acetylhexosaminidase [Rhodanobacteraceae bacterium]MBL0041398.1 beta-N-acetylhexosaminidase [Xanthomonadales bacterium]MBP6077390.1 beta-N-acetylhexosaminidase [Xanthomonadales bacterium]MBP7622460.1 beta-N-acetylhexosaminidase [Xanthomonadales bacterium]
MLMIGIAGKTLAPEEFDWIRAPMVCGVILFTRNFSSREQLLALCAELRAARGEEFLIAVDQEGGPVQRFREGFTALPALALFGERYAIDAAGALALAEQHGWLMACEMLALGIDLSFAPCVDLKRGNRAIGQRAFHDDPAVVAAFAAAYVRGMHKAGMAATLKHFPGHGSVLEDTHFDAAVDPRPFAVIEREDLYPFTAGFAAQAEAVMMAHVSYPAVAPEPAGYSPYWIRDVLRERLKFAGIVFSDDIGMAAAESAGGIKARIDAHLDAGCDIVLVCAPTLVAEAIVAVSQRQALPMARLASLRARAVPQWSQLLAADEFIQTRAGLAALSQESVA